nr:hypothetical protein [Nostoc sp. CreGUA01]
MGHRAWGMGHGESGDEGEAGELLAGSRGERSNFSFSPLPPAPCPLPLCLFCPMPHAPCPIPNAQI